MPRSVQQPARVFYDIDIVVEKDTRRKQINLSALPAPQKRAAWGKIKRNHPALAALLQSEHVAQISKTFNAQVMVDEGVLA